VCTAFRALNAPLLKDNYLSCQDLPPNPFLTKHLLPLFSLGNWCMKKGLHFTSITLSI
jgi:hypothetical protein